MTCEKNMLFNILVYPLVQMNKVVILTYMYLHTKNSHSQNLNYHKPTGTAQKQMNWLPWSNLIAGLLCYVLCVTETDWCLFQPQLSSFSSDFWLNGHVRTLQQTVLTLVLQLKHDKSKKAIWYFRKLA